MLQAPMFEYLSLDPFSLFDDGGSPAEVGISWRHVVEALVVLAVVVVLDERYDLVFEVTGQEVVLQRHTVLEGLVPAFDLALGLSMKRTASSRMLRSICSSAISTICCWICSPMRLHTRLGADDRSASASGPPSR